MSTALVLGGSTGIGAAVIEGFRDRGDDVLLVDTNVEEGKNLMARAASGRGAFLEIDLASDHGPEDAVVAALRFGQGRLDTVFYNAGLLDAHPLGQWSIEQWNRSMAVNLRAPFFVAQRAADALAASPVGRFVLTSSTGAFRGHAGMVAYHASKSGGLGMIRALADELGPRGVTVNAVCPGWIDTPFNDAYWQSQANPDTAEEILVTGIPLRRQGTAADVVGTVLFLASEASAYITGQSIIVDGGYLAV